MRDGKQITALQLVGKARVASQHDTENGSGVELGGGEQTQFAEYRGLKLLRFVDQQDGTDRFEVILPTCSEDLEAAPSVVGAQRDVKEFAHLAVEVGEVGRGMGQGGDHQIAVARQPIRKQTQNHALADARLPDDQGEATVADQMLVDAPAEAFDARRERLDRQFRREGIPFEAVEGE